MTLHQRLTALERRMAAHTTRCDECGGSGGLGCVILEDGEELVACVCGGFTHRGGAVGGMVTVILLHDRRGAIAAHR